MANYLNIESTRIENPRYLNLNDISSKSSLSNYIHIKKLKSKKKENRYSKNFDSSLTAIKELNQIKINNNFIFHRSRKSTQ